MKTKSTAIVLAFFFSFWSWLYTYRRNSTKFWLIIGINLIIAIALPITSLIFGGTLAKSVSFVTTTNVATKVSASDNQTLTTIFIIWIFIGIFEICVWIWSLIDNAIKPRAFYLNYPYR